MATVLPYASGLNNPRGLHFGPDGYLYVAEGGVGGSHFTDGECTQVRSDSVGPYSGSQSGSSITRIDRDGNKTPVATFPSSQTSPGSGALISGVADLAFIDGTMYALLAGAGCSHGVEQIPNGIARVNANGTWDLIANLSLYQMNHPTKVINPPDFEPDGTWWSMVAVRGDLYAVEPNHGEMVKVTTDGSITRVIDISASQGHAVPTSIAYHGVFYVANLGQFDPEDLNTQSIYRINPAGHIQVVTTGLSKVLGLAFDHRDRLYVLETSYSTSDPGPVPFTGRILRIEPNGKQTLVADHFFFPTGMTFGPDGALYVSNVGFGPPPFGLGEIKRVVLSD
ncbi:MAG: ScyD/ScyE family protein [Caldimonas sp.]